MTPRQNKGQETNKDVTFWHSLKVKPGFLILLTNLKTGGIRQNKGAQKYGKRQTLIPLYSPPI